MYRTILLEVADGIATVTLNRPEKLNAYTPQMGEELLQAFGRLRDDPDTRAVVLAGAGRGFCAGVDLEELERARRGEPASGPRLGEEEFLTRFPLELASFPKPVVAAVHGAAIGVGVTMILGCDLRVAADSARLALPFTRLGLLPGLGSTHWLPRLVGLGRALDLVLSGRTIDAQEAREAGLVTRVVAAASLRDEARALAAELAQRDPAVLLRARRALRRGGETTLEEAVRNEAAENAALRRAGAP
jgi:2-(1,2-epoxy-1,2-dihydrophenyl)acetyl-CoA isomerase